MAHKRRIGISRNNATAAEYAALRPEVTPANWVELNDQWFSSSIIQVAVTSTIDI